MVVLDCDKFAPNKGTLSISKDISDAFLGMGMQMASSRQRSGMLLNKMCEKALLPQISTWPQMSIALGWETELKYPAANSYS